MKKILIVIHDLQIGGAQKGLVNFLRCFHDAGKTDAYDIRLLVLKPDGALSSSIPGTIKQVMPSHVMQWFSSHLHPNLLWKCFSIRGILGEIWWLIGRQFHLFSESLSRSQKMWECWKTFLPEDSEVYDVAVSYMDGGPSYYVMDKVKAKKKILWVHSEYQKQGYLPEYDRAYYESCDGIVTISERCRQCILKEFPQLAEKVHVLENITSFDHVLKKSREKLSTEFPSEGLKILSVGRLHEQKGFDMAIEAAALLKNANIPFTWLVAGEGSEREKLQRMIDDLGLSECFVLVGARENPYVYMRECTILVQPSRVEGKSIVLDEAKILCKPIVATNYTTVWDSIDHGVTGWIVEMTPEGIAGGIIKLWKDDVLRSMLVENLSVCAKGNEEELNRYINIMFE